MHDLAWRGVLAASALVAALPAAAQTEEPDLVRALWFVWVFLLFFREDICSLLSSHGMWM